MNLYAVVFDPANEATEAGMDYTRKQFSDGDYFTLCSNVLLVKSDRSVTRLSSRLRLSRITDYTAIIFHLDEQIAGYFYQTAWDWIMDALEEVER